MFFSHSLTRQKTLAHEIRQRGVANAETSRWLLGRITGISPHFATGYYPRLSSDQTYATAMFMDCGMIAMAEYFDDYAAFLAELKQDRGHDLIKAENRAFETNHALAGYLMAKEMGLPEAICGIILDHHSGKEFNKPGQKIKNLGFAVLHGLTLLLGHLTGEISRHEWEHMAEKVKYFFAISDDDIEKLAAELLTEHIETVS